jgi:Matrixin
MAKARTNKVPTAKSIRNNPFQLRNANEAGELRKSQVQIFRKFVCDTESPGRATPGGLSIEELVLNAPGGVIPLWEKNTTLRWRFRESSLAFFQNPAAAKTAIKDLFAEVVMAWGDSAPIKFSQDEDTWDFEIVVKMSPSCDSNGCVLASAFFPDEGRHPLWLYPTMFTQERQEQVETLAHEIGHVFGLRHFFAQLSETNSPSVLFGMQNPESIMNYGPQSKLTETDKADLKRLYQMAWSGELTKINGTPIKFVKPFHTLAEQSQTVISTGQLPDAFQPRRRPLTAASFSWQL